ncbi:Opsin-5 [Allomyces arbusculus]|nr:Opsin-5 [Allomyces arbusculus]
MPRPGSLTVAAACVALSAALQLGSAFAATQAVPAPASAVVAAAAAETPVNASFSTAASVSPRTFNFATDSLPPLSLSVTWLISCLQLSNLFLNSILLYAAHKGKMFQNSANVLIVNLAIADLGLAMTNFPIWFSNAIMGKWAFGPVACLWNGFACSFFVYNSVVTLFFTTAERYLSIVMQKRLERKVILQLLGGVWIGGIGYAALPILAGGQGYILQSSSVYCAPDWSSTWPADGILKAIMCSLISVTMTIMIIGYYKIISVFRQSQRSVKSSRQGGGASSSGNASASATSAAATAPKAAEAGAAKAGNAVPGGSLLRAIGAKDSPNASANAGAGGKLDESGSTAVPSSCARSPSASFGQSGAALLASAVKRVRATSQKLEKQHVSPAELVARKNEKMLLKRAIAVVGVFFLSWVFYLYVWVATWVVPHPVDPLIDCISGFMVSFIGVCNPLFTFMLDKRYGTLVRQILKLPPPASAEANAAGQATTRKGIR